jgi:hypothetical protein
LICKVLFPSISTFETLPLRGYHETVALITALHRVGRLVVAQAGNGVALVPLPIDYCAWTRATERRIQGL